MDEGTNLEKYWANEYTSPERKFHKIAVPISLAIIASVFILQYRSCKKEVEFRNIPAVRAVDSMYNTKYMELIHPLDNTYRIQIDSLKKIYENGLKNKR